MDTVSTAALDWALTHIKKFGDTDIFPVPFEFDAIAHAWIGLRDELAKQDLGDFRLRPPRRFLVPKPGGGFRIATQLDPLDMLTYTALVYEMAPTLEQHRVPQDQRVACSYRIQLDPGGSFFPPSNGWSDFHQRSSELATSGRFTHVLVADISDFYNQIYHHRIQNALETATVSHERSQNVERFLARLTAKQSRGLPVGPFASILLAEMCLNDVDSCLLRKHATHVRYVDDFRIFCSSRREAITTQHDLVDYLYTAHRLSLESSKTRIMHVERFIREELRDPEEEEQRTKVGRLNELMNELFENIGPYEDPADVMDEEVLSSEAARDALLELFEECVGKPPLHLGLARHLLRRATALHTAILHSAVFQNLEALIPALRDVVKYLAKTLQLRSADARGRQLLRFLESSDVAGLPFVRLWILELIEQKADLLSPSEAFDIADKSAPALGVRPFALLARKHHILDWVREQKETWRNHGDWDRRAIIWSASVLPSDERRHWLDVVGESTDPLDRAVAHFAAIQ